MFDGAVPRVYLEYALKAKFGWTQGELEAEAAEDIDYYLTIMNLEAQRQKQEQKHYG